MLIINSYISGDEDASAFINAIGSSNLTGAEQQAIKNLVKGLKNNGTWGKYHAIYPMIGGTAAAHKWNLIDPQDSDSAFRLTFAGTWTHNANGAKGDGSTAWANTHWISGTHASGNNLMIGYWSQKYVAGGDNEDCDLGYFSSAQGVTGSIQLEVNDVVSNAARYGMYTNSLLVDDGGSNFYKGSLHGWGYFQAAHISGTSYAYHNGLRCASIEVTPNTLPTDRPLGINTIITGLTSDYSPSRSPRICAFTTIAEDLTLSELAKDFKVIEDFQNALGRGSQSLDILKSTSDDFAGARWSPDSTNEPDNSSSNAWTEVNSGTYTLETTNVYRGTTSLRFSGSAISDEVYSTVDETGVSTGDGFIFRGKVLVVSGSDLRLTVNDATSGTTDFLIDESNTTTWQDFEVCHAIGSLTNLRVGMRGTGTMYVDDIEVVHIDRT